MRTSIVLWAGAFVGVAFSSMARGHVSEFALAVMYVSAVRLTELLFAELSNRGHAIDEATERETE